MATLGLSSPRAQCTSTSVPREEACPLPPTSPFLARYVDHLSQVQTLARPILSASRAESKVVSWFPPKDTYCNLGWALVAADMNGDREPDLVIGSPFAPGGGKQKGIVAAFYSDSGHSNKGNTCWGEDGGLRCSNLWDFSPIGLSFFPHSICFHLNFLTVFYFYNVLASDSSRSTEYSKRDPTSGSRSTECHGFILLVS